MKEYILPIALAGLGTVVLLHSRAPASLETKLQTKVNSLAVPQTQARSWSSTTLDTNATPSPQTLSDFAAPPAANVSPSSQGAQQTAQFDKPYTYFQETLNTLSLCLRKQNCSFPNKDPKAYESSVYIEMERTLKTLRSWQERHKYKDERIPDLMGDFLPVENAYIKIEALKIMHTQSPDPANLNLILENVIQFPQPEVVPYGMAELLRYKQSGARKQMDDVFEKVLLQGGINSAEEVAKNIKPFVTQTNYSRYRTILAKLDSTPMSGGIAEALRIAID